MSRAALPTIALILACFAVAAIAGAETTASADEDRYVDRTHGFSFTKPRFAPSDEPDIATIAVTLSGAPVDAFAPNVNVIVHNLAISLDAYQQKQILELKAAGWNLIEQDQRQVGGRATLRTHARGSVQGREIEFLAVAVRRDPDAKKIYVLTCTATTAQFPLHQAEFERVAASFALQP